MKSYLASALLMVICGHVIRAHAEGGCPQGQTPTMFGSMMGCAPGGNDPPPQQMEQLQQPQGRWMKTWGAIAADGEKGILGRSSGLENESAAKSQAMADCISKGGACEAFSYYDQCAALVVGDRHYVVQRALTMDQASEIGIQACVKEDSGCRVYFTACSNPKFIPYR